MQKKLEELPSYQINFLVSGNTSLEEAIINNIISKPRAPPLHKEKNNKLLDYSENILLFGNNKFPSSFFPPIPTFITAVLNPTSSAVLDDIITHKSIVNPIDIQK